MPPYEPRPVNPAAVKDADKFMPHPKFSGKRPRNSDRDKRERWYRNHPASGHKAKHGRERGR